MASISVIENRWLSLSIRGKAAVQGRKRSQNDLKNLELMCDMEAQESHRAMVTWEVSSSFSEREA